MTFLHSAAVLKLKAHPAHKMSRPRNALEFKGRMLSINRAQVLDADTAAIKSQIEQFARRMPQAAKGMTVIIDSEVEIDLAEMVQAMRSAGMQPLGVSDGVLAQAARALGLAVVAKDSAKTSSKSIESTSVAEPSKPAPAAAGAARKPARIVAEPIRSGQQVYAEGGDLIVLTSVSPGAEVIADGCVHVYGKLSGRAIAGARGDESARVFCRKLEAELIAIAGIYAVADQIKDGPRGQPAQAYLQNGQLKIEAHNA
jgi:septum site-determining protein MinC